MKRLTIYLTLFLFASTFVACSDDDVDKSNSIYDTIDLEEKNEFDEWLYDNFVVPYNIGLDYKFKFMESEFDYILTPAKFEKATGFAQIIKYCWLECYDEVVGMHFTRDTSPKEIVLIGSPALNLSGTTGTSTLGTAEGGTRVLLYEINNIENFEYQNVIGYMHVMHHEFSHILAQRKPMDPTYEQISQEWYLGELWTEYEDILPGGSFLETGFVSAYSLRNVDEDYAEIYSRYITYTNEEWDDLLKQASANGAKGKEIIEKKLEVVKEYLLESWNIDIEELKKSVQRRSEKASSLEILTFDEFSKSK